MDTYVDIYSYMGMTKDMDIHENGHRNGHGHMNRNTNLEMGVEKEKLDSTNNFDW
jgi:hypothetical protein